MPFRERSFRNLLDSVYPLRSGLLASLYLISVVEVVNFCIATGLKLTKAEESRFLNPAKRVMAEIPHWSCPHGPRPSSSLFLGKDLCKPSEELRRRTPMARGQETIKLVLIMGCPSPSDSQGTLQCRETILSHFFSTFKCSNMEYSEDIAVSIPELATTVYFLNPMRNSRWIESNILTLGIRTVDLLVEHTVEGPSASYTYPRYDVGTVDTWEMYRVSCEERWFTLPGTFPDKRYMFYTLLLEPCMESNCLLLFLFTLPGESIYRQASGRWAQFVRSRWRAMPLSIDWNKLPQARHDQNRA